MLFFWNTEETPQIADAPVTINHNGNIINSTTPYKYLGIQLTPSLNMTSQITDSIKKASTRVRLIVKHTAKLVYKTLILPLFTYRSLNIFGATPNYLKDRIVHIQNRAERIIGCHVPKCEAVCSGQMNM